MMPFRALRVLARVLFILSLLSVAIAVTVSFVLDCVCKNVAQISDKTPSGTLEAPTLLAQVTVDENGLPILGNTEDVSHVLLIGVDRREGETHCRSDAVILLSVNRKKGEISLTSFLRDLYVTLPDGRMSRLNTAYAIGGAEGLSQTLHANFNVDIKSYITVDFHGFSSVIDLLDGVTVNLTASQAERLNRMLSSDPAASLVPIGGGRVTLNGAQALAFVRNRNTPDGDFDRTEAQRTLLSSLAARFSDASLPELLGVAQRVIPMLETNLSPEALRRLISDLLLFGKRGIASCRVPVDDSFSLQTKNNMSVICVDRTHCIRYLYDKIYE